MAFYGNPETLRRLLPALPKFTGPDFMEDVEAWNTLVESELESELRAVFDHWPAPNDTDQNIVSTMWHYLMMANILETAFSAMTQAGQSMSAESARSKYIDIRDRLKAGRIQLPGARRIGAVPRWNASTSRRLTMGQGPDEPVDTGTLDQRGLRR